MLSQQEKSQRTFVQSDYLTTLVEAFLLDRRTQGLSSDTIRFYRVKLRQFITFCEAQALTQLSDITPDFARRFLLIYAETHNPGGVHGTFRSLRAFLYWVEEEEIMQSEWKNPIRKIKAPKVGLEPIAPIPLDDVAAMIATCKPATFRGGRDKAVFLFLLDTGLRAKEFNNLNLSDLATTHPCSAVWTNLTAGTISGGRSLTEVPSNFITSIFKCAMLPSPLAIKKAPRFDRAALGRPRLCGCYFVRNTTAPRECRGEVMVITVVNIPVCIMDALLPPCLKTVIVHSEDNPQYSLNLACREPLTMEQLAGHSA